MKQRCPDFENGWAPSRKQRRGVDSSVIWLMLKPVAPLSEYSTRAETQRLLNNLVLGQTPATESTNQLYFENENVS